MRILQLIASGTLANAGRPVINKQTKPVAIKGNDCNNATRQQQFFPKRTWNPKKTTVISFFIEEKC
jgi:hypothetical protein